MDIGHITAARLRKVLNAIRRAMPLRDEELLQLRFLAERLEAQGIAPSTESREWVLNEVLHETVSSRLAALRQAGPLDVEGLSPAETLAQDFSMDDPELEAWSAVYHRFLCPDLQALRVGEVSAMAFPMHAGRSGERLLGRRMQRALRALEGRFRLLEREALQRRAEAGPSIEDQSDALQPGHAESESPKSTVSTRDESQEVATASGPDTNLRLLRHRGRLLGRDEDVKGLSKALEHERLMGVLGPSGVGKTRLAVTVAQALAEKGVDRFQDGVVLVSLASLRSPHVLNSAVRDALRPLFPGEDERPSATIGDARLLLVLDNCEHLIEAIAQALGSWLEACPHLVVLYTSQERLRLAGEFVWPLAPLAVEIDSSRVGGRARDDGPSADQPILGEESGRADDLPDVLGSGPQARVHPPAIQLFIERALKVRPGFSVDEPETLAVVKEICRRLDGIPLAIELAAARAGLLEPEEIARRLDDRFRLLSKGDRDHPERHRSLEAALAWSYELLDGPAQSLLRRLSVFHGSFSLPAAEEVCADKDLLVEDILEISDDLVERCLILPAAKVSTGRLRLLESVRAYAQTRLEAEAEAQSHRDRHLAHYLKLALRAAPGLRGRDQASWLARLANESDNLRAALGYVLETASGRPKRLEQGLRMAVALHWFWIQRGNATEGRRWVEALLESLFEFDDTAQNVARDLQVEALEAAGALAWNQCDYPAARRHLDHSLQTLDATDDRHRAAIFRSLGNVAVEEGERLEALDFYTQSRDLYYAVDDRWGVAAVRNNIGLLHQHHGELAAASENLEASLEAFQALGETWAVGVTLFNLANVASDSEKLELAEARYTASLEIAVELQDLGGQVSAWLGLANVARRSGNNPLARKHYLEARPLLDALGDAQRLAEWLEGLASVLDWRPAAHASKAKAPLEPTLEAESVRALQCLAIAKSIRTRIGAPATPSEATRVQELEDELRLVLGESQSEGVWLHAMREGIDII